MQGRTSLAGSAGGARSGAHASSCGCFVRLELRHARVTYSAHRVRASRSQSGPRAQDCGERSGAGTTSGSALDVAWARQRKARDPSQARNALRSEDRRAQRAPYDEREAGRTGTLTPCPRPLRPTQRSSMAAAACVAVVPIGQFLENFAVMTLEVVNVPTTPPEKPLLQPQNSATFVAENSQNARGVRGPDALVATARRQSSSQDHAGRGHARIIPDHRHPGTAGTCSASCHADAPPTPPTRVATSAANAQPNFVLLFIVCSCLTVSTASAGAPCAGPTPVGASTNGAGESDSRTPASA